MTKIGIVSDLHLEHRETRDAIALSDMMNATDCDVMLNAGDTHPNALMRDHFHESITIPYAYTMGNHDYYGKTPFSPHMSTTVFGDLVVAATTLWTDFNDDPICEFDAGRFINDFRKGATNRFTTEMCKEAFHESVDYLKNTKGADVWLLHFAPHPQSTHERFVNDTLNPYFVPHLSRHIPIKDWPRLVIHGHVHDPHDYEVSDKTRVVANPLGYPGETWKESNYRAKVVEL